MKAQKPQSNGQQGRAGKPVNLARRRGRPNIHEDVPVSLAPLDFETALAGLLQVPPESKGKPAAKKKAARKKGATGKAAKS